MPCADDEKLRAAWAYAHRKLGFILTDDNAHLFSEEDQQAWASAVDEYLKRSDPDN